jgi:glycosyltransferase involved in cell wall biosynthesis
MSVFVSTPSASEEVARVAAARPSPKLAVVIACHNYEAFVARAIRSVVSQQCLQCELVVVDDASTDRSWEIISASGVQAIRLSDNVGQAQACMRGLDETTAPFILFLDADDELIPGSLQQIIDRLDDRISKLQFPLEVIDAEGRAGGGLMPVLSDFRGSRALRRQVLRDGVYLTPPTSGNVLRRDVCQHAREATYDRVLDGVALFAAPFHGDVVSLSQPLGRYRIHSRNKSGFGRTPDLAALERLMRRFEARMTHLRKVISALAPQARLAEPSATYYHGELSFWRRILLGQRTGILKTLGLIRRLFSQSISLRAKVALGICLLAADCLSNSKARSLLALRFDRDARSGGRLLKVILAPGGASV